MSREGESEAPSSCNTETSSDQTRAAISLPGDPRDTAMSMRTGEGPVMGVRGTA